MSDSVRPQRRQPTRLLCPWDSAGKNTGVGCHFLLQCIRVKSQSELAQLRSTLRDPMDCTHQAPPSMGFSRQEYWSGLLSPSLGDLPDPGIEHGSLKSSALAGEFFTTCVTWEALLLSHSTPTYFAFFSVYSSTLASLLYNTHKHRHWGHEDYGPLFKEDEVNTIYVNKNRCVKNVYLDGNRSMIPRTRTRAPSSRMCSF